MALHYDSYLNFFQKNRSHCNSDSCLHLLFCSYQLLKCIISGLLATLFSCHFNLSHKVVLNPTYSKVCLLVVIIILLIRKYHSFIGDLEVICSLPRIIKNFLQTLIQLILWNHMYMEELVHFDMQWYVM